MPDRKRPAREPKPPRLSNTADQPRLLCITTPTMAAALSISAEMIKHFFFMESLLPIMNVNPAGGKTGSGVIYSSSLPMVSVSSPAP